MLFNMVSGISYGLETVSGSFSGISAPRVLTVSKTVEPLLLAIKTTVGSSTELIAYYRRKPEDSFESRTGGSTSPVTCRLLGEYATKLLLTVRSASEANTASVEYYILGVKKQ